MKADLRFKIAMDAQACEEIAIGDQPMTAEELDERESRARRLLENIAAYRLEVRRGGEQ